MKRAANALVDDPDWCGHAFVSRRIWTCADCERPATAATRLRLQAEPTLAPPGALWVLLVTHDADADAEPSEGVFYGMFTDRARIGRILVRQHMIDAAGVRERLLRTHWYQGVFAPGIFHGFNEEPDRRGRYEVYAMYCEAIDRV